MIRMHQELDKTRSVILPKPYTSAFCPALVAPALLLMLVFTFVFEMSLKYSGNAFRNSRIAKNVEFCSATGESFKT